MKTSKQGLSVRSVLTCAAWVLALWMIPGGCQQPDSENKPKPNLLLITMDTTRWDHLSCYGYKKIKTPVIQSLADEGVVFENAFSVQPVTLPSHTSIMTGCYPYHHGVRDNGIYKLQPQATTLAEILQSRGYLTTAFLGSYILNGIFGLSQGFEYYNDEFIKPKQKGMLPVDRRASEVSFLADEWLTAVEDRLESQPFFLWLHYYDPHADYDPPEPFRSAFPNPYDGEIAYTDDWIGYVLDSLKLKGYLDNTLIVLMADHGESLDEHGEKTHGLFIYDATIHVPLIIRYPKKIEPGIRISEPVSSIDIVPTVLELLQIKTELPFDGISLMPVIQGAGQLPDRALYSEAFIPRSFNWSDLRGLRKNGWLYIKAPRCELYPPGSTCKIEENQYLANTPMKETLESKMKLMLADEPRNTQNDINADDEMVQKLMALGYFMGSQNNGQPTGDSSCLPDPKDRIEIYNASQRAANLVGAGMEQQALEVLENLIKSDSRNPRLLQNASQAALRIKSYDTAEKYLREALKLNPDDSGSYYLLGLSYVYRNKTNEAFEYFQKAVEQNPRHFLSRFQMGLISIQKNDWNNAKSAFEECNKINPKDSETLNNLGYIAIKGFSDYESGISFIAEALKVDPENAQIHYSLGLAYQGFHKNELAKEHLEKAMELIPDNLDFIRSCRDFYLETGDQDAAAKMTVREKLIEENTRL